MSTDKTTIQPPPRPIFCAACGREITDDGAIIAHIVEQSDYPGEAAEQIAAALGVSFAEGLALAEKEIDR